MTVANYAENQTPQFQVLNAGQRQELFYAALECLQRIGVEVQNAEARQLLELAGARLEGARAFIPPGIIQQALLTTPHTFTIWGRTGECRLDLAPNRVYFGPGPTCTNFIDPYTGERRLARRGDAALTARVVDALPNLDFVMGLSLFSDVPAELSPVYEFAESLTNTSKPLVAWAHTLEGLKDIYAIACAVAGGEAAFLQRPNFGFFATFKSPLQHTDEDLGNLLWAAEHGIPVIYLGGPTVGLESPVTGASGLVLYLAAALSGLAVVQQKRPGAAIAIGGVPSAMDLRTARPAYGSPEMVLHTAAAAEMAQHLGVPFMGTAGASESKLLDAQAGAEISLQLLVSGLSGAGMVHDLGFLDCADIGSLPLLVLADEVIAMVKRVLRGIPINRTTIMMDLIEKIGPGGSFIAEPESVALCRREIWAPGLMDRNAWFIWENKGRKDLQTRSLEKLQQILATHHPQPLPPEIKEQINAIVRQAETKYSV